MVWAMDICFNANRSIALSSFVFRRRYLFSSNTESIMELLATLVSKESEGKKDEMEELKKGNGLILTSPTSIVYWGC